MVEFEIRNDDFGDSVKFRNVAIRLIYQTISKKGFNLLSTPDELEQFCPFKDTTQQKEGQKIREVLEAILKEPHVGFSSIGELLSLDNTQPNSKPYLIDPNFIIVLRQTNDTEFEIQIYNQEAQQLYKKAINQHLQYYVNSDIPSLNWLDEKGGNQVHFQFKFNSEEPLSLLNYTMTIAVMQSMKGKKIEDIVKEGSMSDWEQYYANPNQQYEEEVTAQPQYNDYVDYSRNQVDWNNSNTFVEPTSFKNINHSHLAQGKTLDRTFVTQENNISVYQTFEDDHFAVHSF